MENDLRQFLYFDINHLCPTLKKDDYSIGSAILTKSQIFFAGSGKQTIGNETKKMLYSTTSEIYQSFLCKRKAVKEMKGAGTGGNKTESARPMAHPASTGL